MIDDDALIGLAYLISMPRQLVVQVYTSKFWTSQSSRVVKINGIAVHSPNLVGCIPKPVSSIPRVGTYGSTNTHATHALHQQASFHKQRPVDL